jgi:5'-nucleotidase
MNRYAKRPLILVSNDDGIDAPGLLALKQALEEVGGVTVCAPEHNWSAAGHTKTMHKPLRISETTLADGSRAYTTSGAPSDCVALAIMGILHRKPDLVVSGINRGANLGHDLTYSGTVAAAMEGVIFEVPAIAASLDCREEPRPEILRDAAAFIARLALLVLTRGLPRPCRPHGLRNTLLNVNIPNRPWEEIAGVEVTRQGQRVYRDVLVERKDPWGRNYYWIGGDEPTGIVEEGTDVGALYEGKISITPVQLDLTNHEFMDELRKWEL